MLKKRISTLHNSCAPPDPRGMVYNLLSYLMWGDDNWLYYIHNLAMKSSYFLGWWS